MRREDIEKLLGGYATNSLTEQERKALFEAALHDQSLFDQLAQEQALKDVLDDPLCRAAIAREFEKADTSPGWRVRIDKWLRRPATWAAVGSAAAACLLIAVLRPPAEKRAETEKQPAMALHKAAQLDALADAGSASPAPPAEKPAAAPVHKERAAAKRRARLKPVPERPAEPAVVAKRNAVVEPPKVADAGAPPAPAAPQPADSHVEELRAEAQSKAKAADVIVTAPAQNGFRAAAVAPSNVPRRTQFALVSQSPACTVTVLRRAASGDYVNADPLTGISAGDSVRLKIVPIADGQLMLFDSAGQRATVISPAARAGEVYEYPVTLGNAPGEKTIHIVLSPAGVVPESAMRTTDVKLVWR